MTSIDFTMPYAGARMPVLARNVVATSQPLATQAGLDMLRRGGNAVDAALAAAITLTVVEPTSNGIGGDAFAMVWDGAALHGLNASGRSPAAATAADFAHCAQMPLRGWGAVTVPGAVSAWAALSQRFGKLPFHALFAAAIGYASEGFAVSPHTATAWAPAPAIFREALSAAEFADFCAFLPDGRAPAAGDWFRLPEQADTLAAIASSGGEDFYRGALADKIAAAAHHAGARLTAADLAAHHCEWVTPLSQPYRSAARGDIAVHELPPNGQGLAALMMLGIIEQHGMAQYAVDSADFFHLQIEAMKLAFADAYHYIADSDNLPLPPQRLLAADYLRARATDIDMTRAAMPQYGTPPPGGTVYLTAADQNGMMVSFIQSNFWGFGSGIVIARTGISLHNRGAGFNLQPGHANQFAGAKRPYHTIIPGFITQNGQPLMSFGVMGGAMQPQGHAQMVIRVCDYGQNPQSASDAPRWQVTADQQVALEPGVAADVRAELRRRGHRLCGLADAGMGGPGGMGGAQLIYKGAHGYIAGSDHRKDGMAAGF